MGWPTSPENWRKLKPLARKLRREQTEAEKALWQAIRKGQLRGYRFQRQRVFERFIADFYCPEAELAIEVDGRIHDDQQDQDGNRQAYLELNGMRVLRFSNDEVLRTLNTVVKAILENLPDKG